jgi:glycosyltransferase involved in cell wall biosynthesis
VAGIPELVDDGRTGLLVPPGRPNFLAHALAELVRSSEVRRTMGAEGRIVVERAFNVGTVAEEILRLFRRLEPEASVVAGS